MKLLKTLWTGTLSFLNWYTLPSMPVEERERLNSIYTDEKDIPHVRTFGEGAESREPWGYN